MTIKLILILSIAFNFTYADQAENKNVMLKNSIPNKEHKKEIVENPTLKTLSGSLNQWSLYSTFTYRGGSLKDPTSAERPNIKKKEATPNLTDMSGVFGLKYRLTKNDNISLQVGIHSTTPLHSSLETDNKKNQSDFDKNHQKLSSDDPTLSYFRTYYIGQLQNISFLKYQYVTRESYREYGGRSILQFSHAAAYRLSKSTYIAGSVTYENYAYDKDTINYFGRNISIRSQQPEHKYRANISLEMYLREDISFRLITDVFSYTKMRDADDSIWDGRQQTIALSYFFSRDISIAPNLRFIAEDLRSDRSNLGLTLNMNI